MSEISQYFDEIRRDIKSKPEVASVQTGTAERKHPKFEERTFRVFLKSNHQDEVAQVRRELGKELHEDVTAPDEERYDILVTATYDAN